MIASVLGQVLVVLGAAVFVAAALGLRRFRDPYGRISSVATAAGVGVACVTLGAALLDPGATTNLKAVVAVVLQLLTSAIGAIAIARAALMSGHRFAAGTDAGELADEPGSVPVDGSGTTEEDL